MRQVFFLMCACLLLCTTAFASSNEIYIVCNASGELTVASDSTEGSPAGPPIKKIAPYGISQSITAEIEVYSDKQTLVYTNTVTIAANSSVAIDCTNWENGVYTIVIRLANGTSQTFVYTKE